jgi:tellurite methyltransferase
MFDEVKYPEPDPNKKPAASVWNERYGKEGYLFGKEPALLLKNHVGALRKGKALDVAMGEGRNAVFLAQNGFQMEGLDVSSAAIEKAKKLAAEKNAALEAKTQNLDFFLMPLMKYDTIVMTYFRPVKRFFSELRRGLVLGGTVAIEAHLVEHYKKHGSTNPMIDYEDCYHPNELLHQLKDFNILFYKEIPDGTSHTVQAIALKSKA